MAMLTKIKFRGKMNENTQLLDFYEIIILNN